LRSSFSPDAGESAEAPVEVAVEQPTATIAAQPASHSAATVFLDRKRKRVLPDNKRTAYASSRGKLGSYPERAFDQEWLHGACRRCER
jgi:hypothetical protein